MNESDEHEMDEVPKITEPPIESPDDIIREISRRRMLAEYSADIPPERIGWLVQSEDKLETPDQFHDAAQAEGFTPSENTLGWSIDLESPAHVRRGEVPEEIATMVHEDLHRMTDPETLREMCSSEPLNDLYEGITEYFCEKAVEGLHEYSSGQCYPQQVELAKALENEVGEESLRAYFFRHEVTDGIERVLNRMKRQ